MQSKLDFLRVNRVLKCMNKREVITEHADTWTTNGLKTLAYQEISRRGYINDHAWRILVDVQLNSHWTDTACGIDDPQC